MHPNIPSPDERWPRLALRRAGLMLVALFMPEAVIGWALRQRVVAAELAEKHKREGWTTTHGFLVIMGGFMEYEGNTPIRVLLPNQLESYSLTGNGNFPRISKAEIEDRSKGDAISKGAVILQTGWFVTQCIARRAQGLPITELELVTVAFAALNFVIYVLWWDKPLHVQRGVRVYKKRMTEETMDDGDVETTVGFWGVLTDSLSELPATIIRGPSIHNTDMDLWLARVLLWLLTKPIYMMLGSGGEQHEKRVATFYPPEWVTMDDPHPIVFVVVITSIAFGGIHCIGWSFTFPSPTERTLWRVASLTITCVPCVLASFLHTTRGIGVMFTNENGFDRFCAHAIGTLLSLYILSRLALFVLPFLYLRSLPPAAFHVVHWTSFIPHV